MKKTSKQQIPQTSLSSRTSPISDGHSPFLRPYCRALPIRGHANDTQRRRFRCIFHNCTELPPAQGGAHHACSFSRAGLNLSDTWTRTDSVRICTVYPPNELGNGASATKWKWKIPCTDRNRNDVSSGIADRNPAYAWPCDRRGRIRR